MSVSNFVQEYNILGFSVLEVILCLSLILLTLFVSKVVISAVTKFLRKRINIFGSGLYSDLIDAVERPIVWITYISGFYFALLSLNPGNTPFPIRNLITTTVETLAAIVLTSICFRFIDIFDKLLMNHFQNNSETVNDIKAFHFFPLFKRIIKASVAFLVLIIIIQKHGYSVTSLIAGFGITGLAVGFAARESIANIFGSVSVVVDQAYKVGDWILVNTDIQGANVEGIVEDISLRSTKIRAFDNTMIIIPNNEMANSTIKNVSCHKKRRINEYLDISLDTHPDKVEQAVVCCRKIIENHPELDDNIQVCFNQFGPYSLKILVYAFTLTTDWGEYLKIRQELFLNIMREFEKLGIKFALPAQNLHINPKILKSHIEQELDYSNI